MMNCQALLILTLSILCLSVSCEAFTATPHSSRSISFVAKTSAPTRRSSSDTVSFSSLQAAATTTTDRNVLVQDLLVSARKVGQIGSLASPEDQDMLMEKAKRLVEVSDPSPAQQPLKGVHSLVYSAAPGGSSGRLFGPLYGKVQQTFLDKGKFVNSVEFGPIKISLQAKCRNKNKTANIVTFEETCITLFGNEISKQETKGGGVWKYLFLGEITDVDGTRKLVRVMETPSLFIIEQHISSP